MTTFITGKPDLRLVAEPERPRYDFTGRKIGTDPGKAIEFKGQIFVLDDASASLGGFDSVDEARVFLEEHRLFENPRGFYSQDDPPGALKPTVSEQLRLVTAASVAQDVEGLKAVIEAEQSTHNRSDVLDAAGSALEAIVEALESVPATSEGGPVSEPGTA